MGFLHRRFPLYARPLPFLVGLLLGPLFLALGLGWKLDWSLQTGNVFALLLVPEGLVAWSPLTTTWLLLGAFLLFSALLVGLVTRVGAQREIEGGGPSWWRARFRFYPLVFLLGIFLVQYGLLFAFDASVYADQAPGGYAVFVYLDYAGLLHRPFVSAVGAALVGAGLYLVLMKSFHAGLGATVDFLSPSSGPSGRGGSTKPAPRAALQGSYEPSSTDAARGPRVVTARSTLAHAGEPHSRPRQADAALAATGTPSARTTSRASARVLPGTRAASRVRSLGKDLE